MVIKCTHYKDFMTKTVSDAQLNAYILLDRSGSMCDRWKEAIGSINAYAQALDPSDKVTLVTFDTNNTGGISFDVIRDAVASKGWTPVGVTEVTPRGGTPLLDAVSRIVALADNAANDKTVIVVMTDGGENASREVNKTQASAAVDRCKKRNWEVIFLGADFNAFGEAASVGVGYGNTLNISSGNYVSSMTSLSVKSMMYKRGFSSAMDFNEEDRLEASKA